jgi:hypothetical protein
MRGLALTPGPAPKMGAGELAAAGSGPSRSELGAGWPSPPNPLSHKEFRGGQNMWAKIWLRALGCAGWPSPPAPLPKWERGDSGGSLDQPIAVHGHHEQLFGPPLTQSGEQRATHRLVMRRLVRVRRVWRRVLPHDPSQPDGQ